METPISNLVDEYGAMQKLLKEFDVDTLVMVAKDFVPEVWREELATLLPRLMGMSGNVTGRAYQSSLRSGVVKFDAKSLARVLDKGGEEYGWLAEHRTVGKPSFTVKEIKTG